MDEGEARETTEKTVPCRSRPRPHARMFQDTGLLCDDLRGAAFHLNHGNKFDVDVHNVHDLA